MTNSAVDEVTVSASATDVFRAARDQLLGLSGQYERAREEFRWPEFPGHFNWASDWFDAIAERNDKPALTIVEEDESSASYTYDEIFRRSNQVASWLSQQGVSKGDAVILMLGNQVELWDCMLAVMKLGAIIMPTASGVAAADLTDRVARANVRFVICNAVDAPRFDDVPGEYRRISIGAADGWRSLGDAYELPVTERIPHPETDPEDRLLYYFTSGTTSRPKLVEHTQVSYPVGHLSTLYFLSLRPGDVHLNISSPGWAKHAWSSFFAPWIAEGTILVYNYTRFRAPSLLRVLKEHAVTTFCAPPTVWRMVINEDLSGGPGSLREVIGADEPLNPEVIDQVRTHWNLDIRDGYGQTETTAQVGNPAGVPIKIGSMGRPLPGVPVVLVDPVSGKPVDGVGEGEICLDLAQHPYNLMPGYLDDPIKTAEAMAGGFYHTGDVASIDEDGYITFVGRTDDVFKASDYKISPFELESVLIEHPAVLEAAVVPAPDTVRLAVPKAYIAIAPGHEPDEKTAESILRYAREHLAAYQRVRRVELRQREETIIDTPRETRLEWRDSDFPLA